MNLNEKFLATVFVVGIAVGVLVALGQAEDPQERSRWSSAVIGLGYVVAIMAVFGAVLEVIWVRL